MVSQEPPRLSQFVKFVKFVVENYKYLRVFLFKTDTGFYEWAKKDAVFVNGFGFRVYAVMKSKKTSSAFGQ